MKCLSVSPFDIVAVHVYRDIDVIRIISARKADPKERQQFAGDL